MLIVEISEARAGMTLAAPVADPADPLRDLLNRGDRVEDAAVSHLRELGVSHLYVDCPGLEDLDRHLLPQLAAVRPAIYRQLFRMLSRLEDRAAADYADFYVTMSAMLSSLISQGADPVYLEKFGDAGVGAAPHAAKVAHVALMLGNQLEKYLVAQRARLEQRHAREVLNLGVAGLLHDIGKVKLPPELRERSEVDIGDHGLPADEDADARALWESHARLSYEMLRGHVECSAATAVLHHHQRYDGGGFPAVQQKVAGNKPPTEPLEPAPLKGSDIHVYARILYVADLYANLTRPERNGRRRSNLETLHVMRKRYARRIDPVVFAALHAIAPPFLPGSKVVLDDGSTAAVVVVKAENPYTPVVRRLTRGGDELDGTEFDLSQRGAPAITALPGGISVAEFMPKGARSEAVPARAAA